MDPKQRFSNRVENYVKYRPRYPAELIGLLEEQAGLAPHGVVADLGSGTGISAQLFLSHGYTVYAIEPNPEMRQAAERLLGEHSHFHSVVGSAEATTLAAASVDAVVAAQAFHWFDVAPARDECLRILKPGGVAILMWNSRRLNSTPFLRAYESLLVEFGTDYHQVRHENVDAQMIQQFLGENSNRFVIPNEQRFDYEGLKGRLLSSSYAPSEEEPGYAKMLSELKRIFDAHSESGEVVFEYDTEVFWGKPNPTESPRTTSHPG